MAMSEIVRESMFELAESIAVDDGIDVVQTSRQYVRDDMVVTEVKSITGDVYEVVLVGDYYGDLLCEVSLMPFDVDGRVSRDLRPQPVSFSELSAVGF